MIPTIPEGWFRLMPGDVVKEGDRVTLDTNEFKDNGFKDAQKFSRCEFSVGLVIDSPRHDNCIFIRPMNYPDKDPAGLPWCHSSWYMLSHTDTVQDEDKCWTSTSPGWGGHGWAGHQTSVAMNCAANMRLSGGAPVMVYFARLKPKTNMSRTSTPLKVPVSIRVPDIERLILLKELIVSCGSHPDRKARMLNRVAKDEFLCSQLDEALSNNSINWETWEPGPPPITIGEHKVEFRNNGVQVGCTFVDRDTILKIADRIK